MPGTRGNSLWSSSSWEELQSFEISFKVLKNNEKDVSINVADEVVASCCGRQQVHEHELQLITCISDLLYSSAHLHICNIKN